MARRKKTGEESYETADGFQIEDIEGNAVVDDEVIEAASGEDLSDEALLNEGKGSFWDDEDDDAEEDEHFNTIAENNDWEEGYDY